MVCDMITTSETLHDIQVSDAELQLILNVRSKFKGCECCVEMVTEFVMGLKKSKDGKNNDN